MKRIKNFVLQCYSCYLYKNTLNDKNEVNFLPKIRNFTFYVVSSRQQLEDLCSAGFNLSQHKAETVPMLEKGAIAGMLFIEKELASVEWVAMSKGANKAINIYPLKIDFSRGEAYASGVWTNPKYRGKGLHTYVYFKIYDFLRTQGAKSVLSIVATDNFAAQRAHERFSPEEKIYGKARYLKILGLPFWSERPYKDLPTGRLATSFAKMPLVKTMKIRSSK